MRCRFCFATFQDVLADILPQGHLPRKESLRLIERLAPFFRKITFAGGEPTLCSWLWDLVRSAKRAGMTTMLVTNGSRLSPDVVAAQSAHLDWIVLSIDSASEATHAALGRAEHGKAIPEGRYIELADAIHAARVRLKINTVVTALNASEDLSPLIKRLRPERWKVLHVASRRPGPTSTFQWSNFSSAGATTPIEGVRREQEDELHLLRRGLGGRQGHRGGASHQEPRL